MFFDFIDLYELGVRPRYLLASGSGARPRYLLATGARKVSVWAILQKESVGRAGGGDFVGFRAQAPGPATFWPPEPKTCPFGPFFKRNP